MATKNNSTLQPGQVWLSQFSGNYFHIDGISGQQVTVTRLGYVKNIGQLNEQNFISRKEADATPYTWNLSTFNAKDFRRIARNGAKFKSWLRQNAVNA